MRFSKLIPFQLTHDLHHSFEYFCQQLYLLVYSYCM